MKSLNYYDYKYNLKKVLDTVVQYSILYKLIDSKVEVWFYWTTNVEFSIKKLFNVFKNDRKALIKLKIFNDNIRL